MKDLIHKFMNITLPFLSLFLAFFFLPLYLLFKFVDSLVRKCLLIENVAGKVVVITGASSGIGEEIAYEYAKRGARLVLTARREDRLRLVADKAKQMGSPDVLVVKADVSKVEDCKNFVDQTLQHFHRLDHLVNNAGIAPLCMFEDYKNVADHASIMSTNFWGSIYSTQYAVPHLKESKGKIVVIASMSGWCSSPRLSIYGATKAALISFFETLRIECPEIGITIVTPGLTESELTATDYISEANFKHIPKESVEGCAQAIVNATIRGKQFVVEPAWLKVVFYMKVFCPELLDWLSRKLLITWPSGSTSKRSSKTKTT